MIDANIYSQIKQPEQINVADQMGKMMTLRGMADTNQANQMKIAAEKKSAYTKEAIAEFEYLNSLPPEQQAVAYPKSMMKLGQIGMPTDNLIKDQQGNPVFDLNFYKQQNMGLQSTPEYMAHIKAKKDLEKTDAEIYSLRKKASEGMDPYKMFMLESMRDKSVERLSDKLGTSQDAARTVKNVETQMGFDLDSYDPEKNTADGRKVDLPGVSVPLLGRVKAYSSDARVLDDTASKLFNIELKDRSGAAVTTPELERLKMEYSQGKFNTESELLGAMKRYKSALNSKMIDIEAANPAAASRYAQQGGTTSKYLEEKMAPKGPLKGVFGSNEANAAPLAPLAKGLIRMVSPDGQIIKVPESDKGKIIADGGRMY